MGKSRDKRPVKGSLDPNARRVASVQSSASDSNVAESSPRGTGNDTDTSSGATTQPTNWGDDAIEAANTPGQQQVEDLSTAMGEMKASSTPPTDPTSAKEQELPLRPLKGTFLGYKVKTDHKPSNPGVNASTSKLVDSAVPASSPWKTVPTTFKPLQEETSSSSKSIRRTAARELEVVDLSAKQKKEKRELEDLAVSVLDWEKEAHGCDVPTGAFTRLNRDSRTTAIVKISGGAEGQQPSWEVIKDLKLRIQCDGLDPHLLVFEQSGDNATADKKRRSQPTTTEFFVGNVPSRKGRKNNNGTKVRVEESDDEAAAELHAPRLFDVNADRPNFIRFHSYHITDKSKDAKPSQWPASVFQKASIAGCDVNLESIKHAFGNDLSMSGMSNITARELHAVFNTDLKNPGLHIFSFALRHDEHTNWTAQPRLAEIIKKNPRSKIMIAFMRNLVDHRSLVDSLFDRRMLAAVKFGLLPHYQIKDNNFNWYNTVIKNEKFNLRHNKAMLVPDAPDVRINSYKKCLVFDVNEKYRTLMSSSLIFEEKGKQAVFANYCRPGSLHNARVMEINDSEVLLDVGFNRKDTEGSVPHFPHDSEVGVTLSTETPRNSKSHKFDGVVKEVESRELSGDFAVSINTTECRDLSWRVGQNFKVELKVTPKITPVVRQLYAVSIASDPILPGAAGHDFQNILMGRRYLPQTENHQEIWKASTMNEANKKATDNYLTACGLNQSQYGIINCVFERPNHLITAAQGPPGTGKSRAVSAVAFCAVLAGLHVISGAPTNGAALQLLRRYRDERERLNSVAPEKLKDFKIVYVPTTPLCLRALRTKHTSLESKKNYEDHLWGHFVERQKLRAINPSLTKDERNVATIFISIWNLIQGEKVPGITLPEVSDEMWKIYIDTFRNEWKFIFEESKEKLIVVTTCNNAHIMRTATKWKPQLAIVDEAAFGTEADCLIPLTLGATRAVLVGDHEQLKLFSSAAETSEFSDQYTLSLFQRLVENGHEICVFNVNYRMHPRLAMFPGMCSYEWLGCAENTLGESDDYKKIYATWTSDDCEHLRKRRRDGVGRFREDNRDTRDCRRLFFNTRGSHSATAANRTTIRNFGNINAIVHVAERILAKLDMAGRVTPRNVTILTGYKGQKSELLQNLSSRVKVFDWTRDGCQADTIGSIQGGENDIILLDLTAAHQHYGSLLGFLKAWPRMNVALSRGKSVLWIFGNFDKWQTEIDLIAADSGAKRWGLFMMDLVLRGDIVDLYDEDKISREAIYLPNDAHEAQFSSEHWTRKIEDVKREDREYKNARFSAVVKVMNSDSRRAAEKDLTDELLKRYANYEKRDDAWKKEMGMNKPVVVDDDTEMKGILVEPQPEKEKVVKDPFELEDMDENMIVD